MIYPWKLKMHQINNRDWLFFRDKTYIFTSQLFSWLQNGQLNSWSKGSIALRLGGGFRFDFLRPMMCEFN